MSALLSIQLATVLTCSDILRVAMSAKRLTRNTVADQLGIPRLQFKGILEGQIRLTPELAEKLQALLGASAQDLLRLQELVEETFTRGTTFTPIAWIQPFSTSAPTYLNR